MTVQPLVGRIGGEPEAAADDVGAAGPDAAGQRLVDEGRARTCRGFRLREVAPGEQSVWPSVSTAWAVVAKKVALGSFPDSTDPFGARCRAFPPPPASGTRFDANAAVTPGSASTRRTTSSTRAVIASGV